jgi:hypothetical protein
MNTFEDGERVRYVGVVGLGTKWAGREGTVLDSYRDYDGNRVTVKFDGEDHGTSFDAEDLEAVKVRYSIENMAEDSTSLEIELTDAEAALIQRVITGLNDGKVGYAPTLTMKKEG